MEGHPAVPYVKRLDRMIDIVARLVEQDIADTAAEHDPERRPNEEIVDILSRDQMRRSAGQSEAIPPTDQQPDNVGERIPADRKGSDRNCDRIDRWKRNHEEGHERRAGGWSKGHRWPASYKGGKPDRQGTPWTTVLIVRQDRRDTWRFSNCRLPDDGGYRPLALQWSASGFPPCRFRAPISV